MTTEAQRESMRASLRDRGWVMTSRVSIGLAGLQSEAWQKSEAYGRLSVVGCDWSGGISWPRIVTDLPLVVASERLREIAECFAEKGDDA